MVLDSRRLSSFPLCLPRGASTLEYYYRPDVYLLCLYHLAGASCSHYVQLSPFGKCLIGIVTWSNRRFVYETSLMLSSSHLDIHCNCLTVRPMFSVVNVFTFIFITHRCWFWRWYCKSYSCLSSMKACRFAFSMLYSTSFCTFGDTRACCYLHAFSRYLYMPNSMHFLHYTIICW